MIRTIDIARLIRPVSEDVPAGPNLVHERAYRDLDQAHAPEPDEQGRTREPDWKKIVSLGMETLYGRSKDLQIAAFVVEALGWLDGLDGLRRGFEAFHALQEAFWETAHPTPEDGDLEPRLVPYEFIDEVVPRILHVGVLLTQGSGGENYSLQRFLRARSEEEIGSRDDSIRRTDPAFHTALASALAGLRAEIAAWHEATSDRLGDRAPALKRVSDLVAELATCLVTIDLVSPFPKQQDPPPPPPDVLATDEVTREVRPTSEETAPRPVVAPIASGVTPPADRRSPASLVADLIAAGKVGEAVEVLDLARQSARCRRDRFFHQIELIEVLVGVKSYQVCRPLIEDSIAEVDARNLAEWEDPAVIARLLDVWMAYIRGSGIEDERAAGMFGRLCRLDPARALRLKPPGG